MYIVGQVGIAAPAPFYLRQETPAHPLRLNRNLGGFVLQLCGLGGAPEPQRGGVSGVGYALGFWAVYSQDMSV